MFDCEGKAQFMREFVLGLGERDPSARYIDGVLQVKENLECRILQLTEIYNYKENCILFFLFCFCLFLFVFFFAFKSNPITQ